MLKKALIAVVILSAAFVVIYFDLLRFFGLEGLQDLYQQALDQKEQSFFFTAAIYWLFLFGVGALCLPGVSGLFLLGGAAFGTVLGGLLSLSALIAGTTVAFLAVRFFFAESFKSKFKKLSEKFEKKLEEEDVFYLFSIRLVPVIPYFTISLAFSFTPIKALPFYAASFLGMVPVTTVYSFLGASLAESFLDLEKISDVITPQVVISLSLLGVLPIVSKKFLLPWLRKVFSKKSQHERINP